MQDYWVNNERFLMYILVKHHWIEYFDHPLTALLKSVSRNDELAFSYMKETWSAEYRIIFGSRDV